MARPRKIGLDYFPMDTTLDENFEAIEELHGNDGFTWMVKFWQAAYKTSDGVVDLSGIHGVIGAKKSRISIEKQSEIIKNAIELKLIYRIDGEKFTSTGIQSRIKKINSDRENDRNYANNELSERKQPDNVPIRGEIESKIKEKESKIKRENKNTNNTDSSLVLSSWKNDFSIYRKMVEEAKCKILNSPELIERRILTFFPQLDIRKSLELSIDRFWGTEAGWKNKKKKRPVEINMVETLIKNIDKNKVYVKNGEKKIVSPAMEEL